MSSPLQLILARPDTWQRSSRRAGERSHATIPTGHAGLDALLLQGGWPCAALTEILADDCGIGELQLLAPALAHCSRTPGRLFFIGAPHLPYAPALHALGVRLAQVVVIAPGHRADLLWSLEQVLKSGACGCLLAWLPALRAADYATLRRLQLAAGGCRGPVFLFRHADSAHTLSPAALRLRLDATPGQLELRILKQRGGCAGQQLAIPRPASLLQARVVPELLPVVVRDAPDRAEPDSPHPWPPRGGGIPVTLH